MKNRKRVYLADEIRKAARQSGMDRSYLYDSFREILFSRKRRKKKKGAPDAE